LEVKIKREGEYYTFPRKLKTRKFLSYKKFNLSFVLTSFSIIIVNTIYILKNNSDLSMVLLTYSIILLAMVFFYIGAKLILLSEAGFNKFEYENIQIFEDYIFIQKGDLERKILYNDILQLKCNFGYFKIILTNNEEYFFSHYLERAEYLLDMIYNNNNELLQEVNFRKFRNELISYDHHLTRAKNLLVKNSVFTIEQLFLLCLFFIMFCIKFYFNHSIHYVAEILFVSGVILFEYLLIAFVEKYLNVFLLKQLELNDFNKKRDIKKEEKLFLFVRVGYVMLSIIASFFFYYF
jgi:hypothetical protein